MTKIFMYIITIIFAHSCYAMHVRPALTSQDLVYILAGAIIKGDTKKMSALLAQGGFDVNAFVSFKNETPLGIAIEKENVDAVKLLIGAGANVHEKSGLDEEPPIKIAARKNNAAIFHELLNAGADVNESDMHGNTALTWAFVNLEDGVARMALDAGAEIPEGLRENQHIKELLQRLRTEGLGRRRLK